MRPAPLKLFVAWGKDQRGSAPLDSQRGDKIPLDPLEKEKPRVNGAKEKEKL